MIRLETFHDCRLNLRVCTSETSWCQLRPGVRKRDFRALSNFFGPSNPNYNAVNGQLTYEDQMEIKKQYFFVIDTPDFAINILLIVRLHPLY